MLADYTVDRESFRAWLRGVLLDRTPTTLVIGDQPSCREAEVVLERGGTVLLTVAGRPVSTMRLSKRGDRYVERALKERATIKRARGE